MGQQKHSQHISMSYKLVDVLAADLSEFWYHEVVSINQNLQEELDTLLSDVEVSRVQILDYTVKDRFRYSFDLNQSEGVTPWLEVFLRDLFEAIGLWQHCSEVLWSIH